jgi:hypothetical protein
MPTITIFDNEHAALFYHQETKIVHHQFKADLDSAHMRKTLTGGIDLLKEHQAIKWLSDNRAMHTHSEEDGEWINANWLPRAIAAGWKYWALVVPNDVMGRMNMSEFVQSFYDRGVRIMVFTDVNEAMRWLEKADR